MRKHAFVFLILAISMLTLVAACGGGSSGESSSKQGTLSGKIIIGPTCAAEPCGGSPDVIYMGRDLILLRSGATSFKVPLGEDGSFSVEIEPEDYVIRMDNCSYNGCNDALHMEKQSAPVRRSPSFWTSTPVSVLRNNLKVSESS